MKAFEQYPQLKQQLVAAALQHQALDEYRAGTYGEDQGGKFVACSIGCAIKDVNQIFGKEFCLSDHETLAAYLGVPVFVPRLADMIFEDLPADMRPAWSARWISAIPEGADLSLVMPRFLISLLDALPNTGKPDITATVASSRKVLAGWILTGKPDRKARAAEEAEAQAAARAAAAAAARAARAAAAWAEAAWAREVAAWAEAAAAWAREVAAAATAARAARAARAAAAWAEAGAREAAAWAEAAEAEAEAEAEAQAAEAAAAAARAARAACSWPQIADMFIAAISYREAA